MESAPNPINVAYSDAALALHTDLAYYESPPGLQFLHCIRYGVYIAHSLSVVSIISYVTPLYQTPLPMFVSYMGLSTTSHAYHPYYKHPSIEPTVHLSIHPSKHLSIKLSIHYMSILPSIHPSIDPPTNPPIHSTIIHPSVNPYISLYP